jgi:hypothetical protein
MADYRQNRIKSKAILLSLLIAIVFSPIKSFAGQKEKISSDLSKIGYTVVDLSQKKLPASDTKYFIVTVSKGGENFKVKVFDGKYFLSHENGKLEPLITKNSSKNSGHAQPGRIKGKGVSGSGQNGQLLRPSLKENSTFRPKISHDSTQRGAVETKSASTSAFLGRAQPSVKLGGSGDIANLDKDLTNGCFQAVANPTAEFGLGLRDTVAVLNYRSGGRVVEPSREFKAPKEDPTTAKILRDAGQKSKRDPVTDSQKEFASQVNSSQMYQYSMGNLWNVLFGKGRPENMSRDQIVAYRNMERLAAGLAKQGKSKEEIYKSVGRQLESQFKGNITLTGTSPNSPWTLRSDGKLVIYSLVNNRDQVLSYTTQSLMLKNDPIYESKRKDWIEATGEYNRLRNNLMFDTDAQKADSLKRKIDSLSQDLEARQSEILS